MLMKTASMTVSEELDGKKDVRIKIQHFFVSSSATIMMGRRSVPGGVERLTLKINLIEIEYARGV